ncbi:MAG: sugar ABC transporter permease [Anaerolineae bacterium]
MAVPDSSVSASSTGHASDVAPPKFVRRPTSLAPYLLLAPAVVFLIVFIAWPMVDALLLSVRTPEGEWTTRYLQRMVEDVNFTDALRNTLLLLILVIPLQFCFAVIMALLIHAKLKGSALLLYAWTIPLAVSDLAAGLVWLSIFSDHGYLNSFLQNLGLINTPFAFLSYENPVSMVMCVVIAELWRATAIVMIIVVAGLQLIPPDYDEAAAVFGANYWQRMRYVTLPMLRPSIQVGLILRTILAFQVFAIVLALAGTRLPVLASEAYAWYYDNRNPNVAAAYALLILIFSLITTVFYLRMLRTRDEELGQ